MTQVAAIKLRETLETIAFNQFDSLPLPVDQSFEIISWEGTMTQRHRVIQTRSLEDRMAEQAAKLKEQASQLPAGAEREALLKRARIAQTGAHLSDWLRSPGLRPPE